MKIVKIFVGKAGVPADFRNPHNPNVFRGGVTNPGRQVVWVTEFRTVAPNICGFSVWNLPHVTLLAPRILN